jgi:hypothetical protein
VVPLVNLKQSVVRFRSPVSGTGREDFKHDSAQMGVCPQVIETVGQV